MLMYGPSRVILAMCHKTIEIITVLHIIIVHLSIQIQGAFEQVIQLIITCSQIYLDCLN